MKFFAHFFNQFVVILSVYIDAVCQTGAGPTSKCVNCKAVYCENGRGPVCRICLDNPRCWRCGRHLPSNCFDPSDPRGRCHNCFQRSKHLQMRLAVGRVVQEINIDSANESFAEMLDGSQSDIEAAVNNSGHQYVD